MADLYREVIDEFERRKISHVREFIPFYISSLATHAFNLINQRKRIFLQGGKVANIRQPILYVAPPGFGKTLFLEHFLESPAYSILPETKIPVQFMSGNMTEASFVGQIEKNPQTGEVTTHLGYAHKYRDGILGCEEFSAVTRSFTQSYNTGLDTTLLTALDSGRVGKERGPGSIEYKTDLTLWAGTQPARYDLGSGFARRFIFLVFTPTWKDVLAYRKARRAMMNLNVNYGVLKNLRSLLDKRFQDINNVTNITFSQEFYTELDKHKIMHYEDEMIERLAIGYWLMKEPQIGGTLEVRTDPELVRLINLQKEYRIKARKGVNIEHTKAILRDLDTDVIARDELISLLGKFSIDESVAISHIQSLLVTKILTWDEYGIHIDKSKIR